MNNTLTSAIKIVKFIFCLFALLIVTDDTANASTINHKITPEFQHTNYPIKILTLENNSVDALNTPIAFYEGYTPFKSDNYNPDKNYLLISSNPDNTEKTKKNGALAFQQTYTHIVYLPAKFFKILDELRNIYYYNEFNLWWQDLGEIIWSVLVALFYVSLDLIVDSFLLIFGTLWQTIIHPIDTVLAIPSALYHMVIETLKACWELIISISTLISHILNS